MLQRNAGLQSQLASSGSVHQDRPASAGAGPGNARSLPANLMSPRDLSAMQVEPVAVSEQYLVFSLLECEFALKAEHIQGVERLADVTTVPNVAPWISGVINLRGSIASVVDLRAFLNLEQLPYNPLTRLLSVNYNDMLICLVVDSVSEMVPIPQIAINGSLFQVGIPRWIAPYASGSAVIGKRGIVLLDAARLLFSDKMQHYS